MSSPITIQLPEEVLIEALQQLSPERRRQLLKQIEGERELEPVPLPTDALKEITGIINIGGDALEDSERIYDE
jgi:hypothetical protein